MITVDTRNDRSFGMTVLQNLVKPFRPMLVKPGKPTPAGSPKLSAHRSAKKKCTVNERKLAETWLYDVIPNAMTQSNTPRLRIYYFAGGAFQSPPSPQHWSFVHELAIKLSAIVTIVSYPLAPNNPAKVSIPHLAKLYHPLLQESQERGEKIVMMGDSAGGNVAIALVLYVLKQSPDAAVPSSILLISPCADATNSNPQIQSTNRLDPILTEKYTGDVAKTWAKGHLSDPLVSPVLDDLAPLLRRDVPLHGVVGTYDVLSPDAVRLLEKAQSTGLSGRWLVWEKQMHCFPLAWRYGLRDSVEAKDWIVQTFKD